jgi:hypothetical protein
MKIKYLGPSDKVLVHPHGEHRKDEIKEYPEKFGKELCETSRKQRFSICTDDAEAPATDDDAGPEATTATTKKPDMEKKPGRTKPGDKKRSQ